MQHPVPALVPPYSISNYCSFCCTQFSCQDHDCFFGLLDQTCRKICCDNWSALLKGAAERKACWSPLGPTLFPPQLGPWFTYKHVYGHQDKYTLWHQLLVEAQQNCCCDEILLGQPWDLQVLTRFAGQVYCKHMLIFVIGYQMHNLCNIWFWPLHYRVPDVDWRMLLLWSSDPCPAHVWFAFSSSRSLFLSCSKTWVWTQCKPLQYCHIRDHLLLLHHRSHHTNDRVHLDSIDVPMKGKSTT